MNTADPPLQAIANAKRDSAFSKKLILYIKKVINVLFFNKNLQIGVF